MNDFTKEELQMLYNMILHIRNDYEATRLDEDATNLKCKIQSMIDNYCEHSSKQFYDKVEGYECNKCHMVMI